MNRLSFFIILLTYTSYSFCSEVINLTDEDKVEARKEIISNKNNPGVRVAFGGIKEMNNIYGLGGVNSVLDSYESNLVEAFYSTEFKKNNPGIKVTIKKTDFKGYFIECESIKGNCQDIVKLTADKVAQPKFPKIAESKLKPNSPNSNVFSVSTTKANSYQEGYVKARAEAIYGVIDEPLDSFVDKKLKEALKEMSGSTNSVTTEHKKKLKENIESFRAGGINHVEPRYQKVVLALDVLLETPFASADNIEAEISSAITSPQNVSVAKTGDDLFLLVKNEKGIEKIVGADARGLGVTNMMTRLDEYIKDVNSSSKTAGMERFFNISSKAMESADKLMDNSLNLYSDLLKKELESKNGRTIDQMIAAAHDKYNMQLESNKELMQIRAGAIDDCGHNPKEIMNRITSIHNRLKLMEKAKVDGFFGMSCLGTEYFLRLSGLK